jgi:thioredoxin-like negative regulator of GroEL
MMRILLSVILTSLLAGHATAAAAPAPYGPQLPPGKGTTEKSADPFAAAKAKLVRIEWRTDLEEAKKQAAAAGRVVLIYFHFLSNANEGSGQPCHLMNDLTFANRGVAQYIEQNFIPVKIDDSKETSEISKKYEIRLYPTILFLSPSGEPMHMVLGPRNAPQLYTILEKVQALPRLYDAQKKSPDDLEANFALAAGLVALDHVKHAEPFLKRVAELDPKNERGRLEKARLYLAITPLEEGDGTAAVENLKKFVADFKDSQEAPTATVAMGRILMQDGKLEEARKVLDDFRNKFPKHRMAYDADKAIDEIDARLKAKALAEKAPRSPPRPRLRLKSPPRLRRSPRSRQTPRFTARRSATAAQAAPTRRGRGPRCARRRKGRSPFRSA